VIDAHAYPSSASRSENGVESDPNDDLLIRAERLPELRSQIEQLGHRLTRMGASAVQLVDTGQLHGSVALVRLEGPGSLVRDWEIVCILKHHGGSTEVEPCVPMSDRQIQRLTAARALCEACRTVRPRSDTFIVRERATGRTMQLGSSCLRPVTGAEPADEAIRRAQIVATIRTVLAGAAHQRRDPGEEYIDTSVFLAHAVSVVRSHGFRRTDDRGATWRAALTLLEQGVEPPAQDLSRADEIREWASQLTKRDGYGYRARLAACVRRERLTSRELPLAASAVRGYNRQLYWQIRHERSGDMRRE
jgi:hypothetical protein